MFIADPLHSEQEKIQANPETDIRTKLHKSKNKPGSSEEPQILK